MGIFLYIAIAVFLVGFIALLYGRQRANPAQGVESARPDEREALDFVDGLESRSARGAGEEQRIAG